MKFYLLGFVLGWVVCHDSSITQPTSSAQSSTNSLSSSSSSSQIPSVVRQDQMTVTETVFTYLTTSTRVTRTVELTVTLTDHSTKLITTLMTTTALSITQATFTTRQRAFVTLSTTLTRIVFSQFTNFEDKTRTTTVKTDTSITTVAIVSLLRTTRTSFFQSSFAVTATFTTQVLVTNQNTLIIFLPSIDSINARATLTVYTDTVFYIVNSTKTNYKSTVVVSRTTTQLQYLQGTKVGATVVLPVVTTATITSFDISSIGAYFTKATLSLNVRHSIVYDVETTLIR